MKRSLLGWALIAAMSTLAACADEQPRALGGSAPEAEDDEATGAETDEQVREGFEEAERDAYVDALTESLTQETPGTDITLSEDEARCAAEGVIETIGLDALMEEITPDEVRQSGDAATDLWNLDLTQEQGEAVLGEMITCAPVIGELMAESLALGLTESLGEDTEVTIDTECLAANTEAVRTLGAVFLTQGSAFTLDDGQAQMFYDWLVGCTDMRQLTVSVMTDEGIPATGAACVNERMDDDLLRRFWVEIMVNLDDLDALDESPVVGELSTVFDACAAALATTDI